MEDLKFIEMSDIIDILFEPENIFLATGEVFSKISDIFRITETKIKISSSDMNPVEETIFTKPDINAISSCTSQTFTYGNPDSMLIEITVKTENLSENEIKNLEYYMKIIYTFISKQKFENIVAKSKLYDIKTGYLTINGFYKKFAELAARNKISEYSLFFMNVKDFKIINRKYGHDEGTRIMAQISRNIDIFLNDDSFFSHLGGDNFVACINKNIFNIFVKMISKLPVDVTCPNGKKEKYFLSFHAGICKDLSTSENQPFNISHIIENAQLAMTMSKRNPAMENIIYFNDDIRKMIIREKEIEASMHDALKNGEFIVVYQPKVNLKNYTLSGAEALVRWKKDGKLIPPDSFIPLFEKNGFVCKVDFYVLDVVCKKIRGWIEKGIEPVKISVNFSKLHTDNPNLVDDIIDVIIKNGISPKYIEIEFTETSYIDNSSQVKDIIVSLRESGIMVSMDDFGTGYSSLNMLKEMPIDILKLDKSFLNVDKDMTKRESIIIKNVIRMAKELDISVISEGVETIEHVEFLKNLCCDMAQGYFFDKPLAENDYEERLIKHIYDDRQTITADM